MAWVGYIGAAFLIVFGGLSLLHAFRVIGKPRGADEKYDAAMARFAPTQKVMGGVAVVMGLVWLLDLAIGLG
jgi:hypothetical protein